MTESEAGATDALVIEGWTVGDVLARVTDVDLDLEWIYWDSGYFVSPEPAPQTVLHLRPAIASATIRGYELEIHDDICRDRIELDIDLEANTEDGVIFGTASAGVTLWISDDRTSLQLSTNAEDLGFQTIWPVEDDRAPPSEVVLRIESEATGLGVVEGAVGTVWLHWVWVTTGGDFSERWEEYFQIATIG